MATGAPPLEGLGSLKLILRIALVACAVARHTLCTKNESYYLIGMSSYTKLPMYIKYQPKRARALDPLLGELLRTCVLKMSDYIEDPAFVESAAPACM